MATRTGLFERLSSRSAARMWQRTAQTCQEMSLDALRNFRRDGRKLRADLDRVISVADDRLTVPRPGTNQIEHPKGTDWVWRPELWRSPLPSRGRAALQNGENVGSGLTFFHDCDDSELTFRQMRNTRTSDLSPYGLRLDVFSFPGSFLSLVIDLPTEVNNGLQRNHLIRLNTVLQIERPLEIFARLNIKHGPNTEKIVRELPLHETDIWVEFDLAYTKLNEKRVEQLWVDLIFEGPAMNEIQVKDLTFSRSPRAEL